VLPGEVARGGIVGAEEGDEWLGGCAAHEKDDRGGLHIPLPCYPVHARRTSWECRQQPIYRCARAAVGTRPLQR
jgi:hypothetical protein